MQRIIPLFAALALAACVTVPAAPATTGTPTAGFGQTANVGPLLIRPIALVEDSRCPINARCVWAGQVRILAEIGRDRVRREMTLGVPIAVAGGKLALVAAAPGRLAGAQPEPQPYRFTFEFSR